MWSLIGTNYVVIVEEQGPLWCMTATTPGREPVKYSNVYVSAEAALQEAEWFAALTLSKWGLRDLQVRAFTKSALTSKALSDSGLWLARPPPAVVRHFPIDLIDFRAKVRESSRYKCALQ
jgi:hypothetical protein